MMRFPFLIENHTPRIIPIVFTLVILFGTQIVFADEESIDVDSLLTEADDFFKSEKYDDAIFVYNRILSLEPDNLEALAKKGDALSMLGKIEQATIMYEQLIKIDPDYVDTTGKPYLDKLIELEPQNVDALIIKGESLAIYYDRLDDALSYFDRVLEIEPDNVNALFDKAEAFFQLDEFEESISWYDESLKVDPNHVGSLSGKGYALSKIDNFVESDFYLDKALEIDPDNVDALYKKGSSLLVQQNASEALSYFYDALKIDPRHFFSEVKLKVAAKRIPYKTFDGFAEAIIHDSDGNLVGNLKIRKLWNIDHPIFDKLIDEWPVVKTINRDGQDYEVRELNDEINVKNRFIYGGARHYGYYFPHGEGLALMQASYWQYDVERGDTVTLIHTVYRPI
jgi:tetratricopeptide (TPR) repeat protein